MTGSKITIDWKALGKEIGGVLGPELRGLLEGDESDVQKYAVEIGESLARNLAAGRDTMTLELKGQLRLIAEAHRIKANAARRDFFEQFATIAMRTVSGVLSAATGAALAGIGPATASGGK